MQSNIVEYKNAECNFEKINEEQKVMPNGDKLTMKLLKERPSDKMWFSVETGSQPEKLPPFES